MNEAFVQAIQLRLESAQHILLITHIRPDGDAIGSLLGFGLALEQSGKTVTMISPDGVPSNLRHLPGSNRVTDHAYGDFDLVCTLDCSDLKRVGKVLDGYGQIDINIDHHVTNLNFAEINLVDPLATATAEILTELIDQLRITITPAIASALLTGIVTDTLGFRTSNMTARSLRTAALLIENEADLPSLYERALIGRSFEAARYWGAGLSRLKRDGTIVWTSLSLEDRKSCNYPGHDDADLINILSSIQESDLAVIFIQQNSEKVKVSWRARPGLDVTQLAMQFGGGGHPTAAGAELIGNLVEVQNKVLEATRSYASTSRITPSPTERREFFHTRGNE